MGRGTAHFDDIMIMSCMDVYSRGVRILGRSNLTAAVRQQLCLSPVENKYPKYTAKSGTQNVHMHTHV